MGAELEILRAGWVNFVVLLGEALLDLTAMPHSCPGDLFPSPSPLELPWCGSTGIPQIPGRHHAKCKLDGHGVPDPTLEPPRHSIPDPVPGPARLNILSPVTENGRTEHP